MKTHCIELPEVKDGLASAGLFESVRAIKRDAGKRGLYLNDVRPVSAGVVLGHSKQCRADSLSRRAAMFTMDA